jgi:hypothetical protein
MARRLSKTTNQRKEECGSCADTPHFGAGPPRGGLLGSPLSSLRYHRRQHDSCECGSGSRFHPGLVRLPPPTGRVPWQPDASVATRTTRQAKPAPDLLRHHHHTTRSSQRSVVTVARQRDPFDSSLQLGLVAGADHCSIAAWELVLTERDETAHFQAPDLRSSAA